MRLDKKLQYLLKLPFSKRVLLLQTLSVAGDSRVSSTSIL